MGGGRTKTVTRQAGLSYCQPGAEGGGACDQLRWRHRAVGGMEQGACRPDEESGQSSLWEVSFGVGKRCTCGEEGAGSCDMGAGFTEPGRLHPMASGRFLVGQGDLFAGKGRSRIPQEGLFVSLSDLFPLHS